MTADIDAEGRWMTYAELADGRGIDRQSARRLAARSKWRRQKDNQQVVRVYVPSASAAPQREKQDMSADMPAVTSADMSIVVKPLEAAIVTLREELAAVRVDLGKANERAGRAEAEAREVRLRLSWAESQVEAERSRADRAEGVAEGLKAAREQRGKFAAWWRARFRP
jgi:hypothetical protein